MVLQQQRTIPQASNINIAPLPEAGLVVVEWTVNTDTTGTNWNGEINVVGEGIVTKRADISGTGSSTGTVTFEYPDIQQPTEATVTGLIAEPNFDQDQDTTILQPPDGGNGNGDGLTEQEQLLLAGTIIAAGGGGILLLNELRDID